MKEVTPQQAYDLMTADPGYIYLDVRSVPEFEAGHAVRAINIPLMHFTPGQGMTPNDDFVRVVEANLPKDAHIVVGCKTGGRSGRACDIMTKLGYSDVANVVGGFVGQSDNTGQVVEPGWSMLNLPQCTNCQDDATYDSLAKTTGKLHHTAE
jgi:rhodanese-related sulfurtransferase